MSSQEVEFTFENWLAGCPVELGRFLFERIPRGRRPGWARQLLMLATDRANYKPSEIEAVLLIASNRREWSRAHDAFSAVRRLVLDQERRRYPEAERLQLRILSLAELVAKVTFNASGELAPFDKGTGWEIARATRDVCKHLDDPALADSIWQQLNTAGVMRDSSMQ